MKPTLILTRPAAQAAGWLTRLQALGVQAESLPLIAIKAHPDSGAAQAWAQIEQAALLIFVSPNAVAHFFTARPSGQAWPAHCLAGVVGPGSAEALRSAGVAADLIRQPSATADNLDSEHLWLSLEAEDWAGRLVLVLRGDGGRDWLAERLRERGARVLDVSVYQRHCPQLNATEQGLLQAALRAPEAYVWLFSSAEAVGHLRQLAGAQADWSHAHAIATHPRIEAAARSLGVKHVVLTRPEAAAVAAAVQNRPLQS